MNNPFSSVSNLMERLRLTQSKIGLGWRLFEECELGQINGVPSVRGIRVATDGIRCILVNPQDLTKYQLGHNDWFEPDVDLSMPADEITTKRGAIRANQMKNFLQFNF